MWFRSVALIATGLALSGAGYASPPEHIRSYIVDDQFVPGDYQWLRGRFPEASDEDKAKYFQILNWETQCIESARAKVAAQLSGMGYPDAKLNSEPIGPLVCLQVSAQPYVLSSASFSEFSQKASEARTIAKTYIEATKAAARQQPRDDLDLKGQLLSRPISEQMLRDVMTPASAARLGISTLPGDGLAVFQSQIVAATEAEDHANTQWLKEFVAKNGWPKISRVGKHAAKSAWLIAQHADSDPVFQLEVLRLMAPLIKRDDVEPANYGYLFDRVMLKLTGQQRYGTQVECRNGDWVPRPLSSPASVAQLRHSIGLKPLEAYLADVTKSFGPCAVNGMVTTPKKNS
jgi:hypothetical protein